ncbi:hypothetical protein [Zooshikella ganghwensis]|uniref:hypothetical protein n=1 Tax=Zooshikella ganghwensis TaxID=202772 RepID=UPI000400A336|nr:hypothetical protein [Zooshikella ganghwensis]
MRSVLLACLLFVASLAKGEELGFDWALLDSTASVQEKYDHLIEIDATVLSKMYESRDVFSYFEFYAKELDVKKYKQRLSLLKSISSKFVDYDPEAERLLGTLYYAEGRMGFYKYMKDNPNALKSDTLTYLDHFHSFLYSNASKKGIQLYESACKNHNAGACLKLNITSRFETGFCLMLNDNKYNLCKKETDRAMQMEMWALEALIHNYNEEDDELTRAGYAFSIYAAHKYGLSIIHDFPNNQRIEYKSIIDSKKAAFWKKCAEKYIKENGLEGSY